MDAGTLAKETLKTAGFLVYDPGEHPGKCEAPYIVIREMGTYALAQSGRIGYTLLTVNIYVPLKQYGLLAPLVQQAKDVLRSLRRQLRPTGHETPDMIEEAYNAHTRHIEYQVQKPL